MFGGNLSKVRHDKLLDIFVPTDTVEEQLEYGDQEVEEFLPVLA
jgi:hypothetical protein